jgi:hypothetical protein
MLIAGDGSQADPLRAHEMTEIEIVIAAAGGQRQADVFTARGPQTISFL